jgi:hypothetical protein
MNNYVLSTFLSIGNPVGIALPSEDAPRYVAKAIYREMGLDKSVARFEKKHLKLEKYPELAYIGIVVRIATENRISYEWRF